MNHAEWVAGLESARKLRARKKTDEAIATLQSLEKAARKAQKDGLSDRYETQALELRARILKDSGRTKEAAKAYQTLITRRKKALEAEGSALVNTLSMAALMAYGAGDDKKGDKQAREAIELFGRFYNPSGVVVELLKEVQRRGAARVRAQLAPKGKKKKKPRRR